MAAWKLAPARAAGNCVVLKPAEQTPASIMLWIDLVGHLLPKGVAQHFLVATGGSPMCWPAGEFKLGERDVLLGFVAGAEYWIGGDQYERWKHTRLILDVVPGRGAGFSLEAPEGVRFLIRSEMCTVEELRERDASPLPRGADRNR